jgi:hypothetical protein
MNPDAVSYMMLFCAILLAKNKRIALGDSVRLVPLTGGAKTLAREFAISPAK